MRKALVEIVTGKVTNVIEIEADSIWQPPARYTLLEAGNASPGDTWDGSKFTPQPLTSEEIAEQGKAQGRREAKERAVTGIKANQSGAPWGKILLDLAIAQGWIEE